MIAVSTTCMAEVIGDDLNAFINNTKKEGHIAQDFPVPYAHTPSFVGSHVTGWDNMFEGIARYFTLNYMAGKEVGRTARSTSCRASRPTSATTASSPHAGRDGRRYTLLSDPTEVLDTPADGEFRMYAGGTTHGRSEGCAERHHHLPAAADATGKDQEVLSKPPGPTKCPSSTSRWAWNGPTSG
jgi:nitrogenase molybdenum-iron protein beta chain